MCPESIIYDVVVIGGGHAGIEAALAVARLGGKTLLITINLDTIGQMSCNPAIGGLAKGHITREIDALGGEMALNTDLTGIQFRMLNRRKGPAVWAPRAQCDKKAYQYRLKWVCERQVGLDCVQGQVAELLAKDGRISGVRTTLGVTYEAHAVVLTAGTFLRALMHIGLQQFPGGRAGEPAANELSESLRRLGFELGRLKTGTPPRISSRGLDFSRMECQPGEEPVPYFSHWHESMFHVEQSDIKNAESRSSAYPRGSLLERIGRQLDCHVTYTTPHTAEVIRASLSESPLYSGVIEGIGPRYCPSIEDKVVRFPEKERQQLFLEPEGFATEEYYLNGFSTSLPYPVQVEMVRTIVGCEKAKIMRPAYAVEYDFVPPTQLQASLESKICRGLFLAGQVNGTSGYEEAAGQGLIAGINAVRYVRGETPIILRRDQAYIGVLIDDLVTKGTQEPYRMFTSRAEYRLLLRQDNADLRLCDIGHQVGLLPRHSYDRFKTKREILQRELQRLATQRHGSETLEQMLRRPEVAYRDLDGSDRSLPEAIATEIEVIVKYAGYIQRQEMEVARISQLEEIMIPDWLDYEDLRGLKTETRLKLNRVRPRTVGQAGRISGVTPADISLILVWIRRGPPARREREGGQAQQGLHEPEDPTGSEAAPR
ncbi:MAG TPA: tRNA uridine-5-carboxymethylaminomethyl(34) synthesis enzyme MnmG [Verrucomicrobiota bacterium]|nr:tRNA uridine-5-carboxymethylaminomethyl(34) synthesis enzyme MnmG [Verrucomicrobiota bacterium]HNU49877.1 tRNA uridine-5-carboxymethylaminomethyl(34) synthesis enzyme MnmG [Verrucomicrobiota bacterium]